MLLEAVVMGTGEEGREVSMRAVIHVAAWAMGAYRQSIPVVELELVLLESLTTASWASLSLQVHKQFMALIKRKYQGAITSLDRGGFTRVLLYRSPILQKLRYSGKTFVQP